jgi:hypothetical protein
MLSNNLPKMRLKDGPRINITESFRDISDERLVRGMMARHQGRGPEKKVSEHKFMECKRTR